MTKPSDINDLLEPHRQEQLAAANSQAVARLRDRGIVVSPHERSEDLADLLTAVERFEAVVETHGGDLYVDTLKSSEPDDRHFVLPARPAGENIPDYIVRIEAARARLKTHVWHPDSRD